MIEIVVLDGKIKFIRHLSDSVVVFNAKTLQQALSAKAIWEAFMYN